MNDISRIQRETVVAAFDFDGTLTARDSLLPFLLYSTDFFKACYNLLIVSPWIVGYLFGFVARQDAKEKVLTLFFAGLPYDNVKMKGEEFAKNYLPKMVLSQGLKRINWHLKQGHRCILVSANLEVYLIPWAQKVGFSEVISSRLQIDNHGIVTGKLEGKNCWGDEKTRRLEELLGQRASYQLYAYGDSRGDKELLLLADFPFYKEIPDN